MTKRTSLLLAVGVAAAGVLLAFLTVKNVVHPRLSSPAPSANAAADPKSDWTPAGLQPVRSQVEMAPIEGAGDELIAGIVEDYTITDPSQLLSAAQVQALRALVVQHLSLRAGDSPEAFLRFAEDEGGEWVAPDSPRWKAYEGRLDLLGIPRESPDARGVLVASRRRAIDLEGSRIDRIAVGPGGAWITVGRSERPLREAPYLLVPPGGAASKELAAWLFLASQGSPMRSLDAEADAILTQGSPLIFTDIAVAMKVQSGSEGLLEFRAFWHPQRQRWLTARLNVRSRPATLVGDW